MRGGGTIKRIINPEDKIQVNVGFSNRLKKIAINSLQKKESKQETEVVMEKVIMDRRFLIDAAIVRTMKARQTLGLNDLIAEVVRLVRFPLDNKTLKQRLEHLIEGEYMRRDEKDHSTFHYVA